MFIRDMASEKNMQSLSRYTLMRTILGLATVGLIAAAIGMEFLSEEEAKIYVVPMLVTALFTTIAHTSIYKK
jgi:uncharacterized metal-binding protein